MAFVEIVVVVSPLILSLPCAATVIAFVPALPPASVTVTHVPPATEAIVGRVTVPALEVAIQKTREDVAVRVVEVEIFLFPVANEPFTVKVELGAVVPMPTLPLSCITIRGVKVPPKLVFFPKVILDVSPPLSYLEMVRLPLLVNS